MKCLQNQMLFHVQLNTPCRPSGEVVIRSWSYIHVYKVYRLQLVRITINVHVHVRVSFRGGAGGGIRPPLGIRLPQKIFELTEYN